MFWEYGTVNLPAEAWSPLRLTLPALQSFITLAVCVFTAWYLVSAARKDPGHGPSFVVRLLLIAGATGFLALLYDLAFLDQYLNAHPESRPGSEHHLFSVIANALVSICAFVSVAVFFKARKIKRSPARTDVRADAPDRAAAVPPVQAPPRRRTRAAARLRSSPRQARVRQPPVHDKKRKLANSLSWMPGIVENAHHAGIHGGDFALTVHQRGASQTACATYPQHRPRPINPRPIRVHAAHPAGGVRRSRLNAPNGAHWGRRCSWYRG
jgi:hypothetical protein